MSASLELLWHLPSEALIGLFFEALDEMSFSNYKSSTEAVKDLLNQKLNKANGDLNKAIELMESYTVVEE